MVRLRSEASSLRCSRPYSLSIYEERHGSICPIGPTAVSMKLNNSLWSSRKEFEGKDRSEREVIRSPKRTAPIGDRELQFEQSR